MSCKLDTLPPPDHQVGQVICTKSRKPIEDYDPETRSYYCAEHPRDA